MKLLIELTYAHYRCSFIGAHSLVVPYSLINVNTCCSWWPPRTWIISNNCSLFLNFFHLFVNFPHSHTVITILSCLFFLISLYTLLLQNSDYRYSCSLLVHSVIGAVSLSMSMCYHYSKDIEGSNCLYVPLFSVLPS